MKIILYSLNDIHAQAFKIFLNKNCLNFKEITRENPEFNDKESMMNYNSTSFLKIVKNRSINIIRGFNELMLNQLVEHIKKYNPKIEI